MVKGSASLNFKNNLKSEPSSINKSAWELNRGCACMKASAAVKSRTERLVKTGCAPSSSGFQDRSWRSGSCRFLKKFLDQSIGEVTKLPVTSASAKATLRLFLSL